jgi:hypothetical protein
LLIGLSKTFSGRTRRITRDLQPWTSDRKVEDRPLANGAFGSNAAAVTIDTAPYDGEPDSRTRKLRAGMQAPEQAEQVFGIPDIKPAA